MPGSYSQDATVSEEPVAYVDVQVTQGDESRLELCGHYRFKGNTASARVAWRILSAWFTNTTENKPCISVYMPGSGQLYGEFEIDRVANMDERQLDTAVNKMKNIEIG